MARPVLAIFMTTQNVAALVLAALLAACGSGANKADATAKGGPPACAGDISKASASLQKAYQSFQRRTKLRALGPGRSFAHHL